MKKTNTIAVCAVILAVIVLCGGCASVVQNFENAELRQYTDEMLDAVIGDDFQAAYSLVSGICSEADFAPIFAQMQSLLGDADTYTLKLLSISTNSTIHNGQKISTTSAVYELTTNAHKVVVSIRADSQAGLSSFYLTPYEKTDYYFTGTVDSMADATGAQWIFLLLNLPAIGLTVFALIDCCRHKIHKKVLWILLLIFGFVSVGAKVSSTEFMLNFNVGWIMAYTALVRYGSGALVIRLMMPVGAVSYFIARRSLLRAHTATTVPGETGPATFVEETNADPQSSQTSADHPIQSEPPLL